MASRRTFDSPWKMIVEALFPEFMQFCVPAAHAEIDWSRPPRFLDKELAQAIRGARSGAKSVDQLVEVALLDGSATWVLVHIEVQAQHDAAFAGRMYEYHTRIYHKFRRAPVSLAVLADGSHEWRPAAFSYSRWGCNLRLEFPVVKLMDWHGRHADLLASRNPFAIVVAAHLAALAAGARPEARFERRKDVYRDMRRMGVSQEQAMALMTFMDWVLELPEELDDRFWGEVGEEEGGVTMQYMSRFERKAMERGRLQGVELGRVEGEARGVALGEARGVALGEARGVALGLRQGLLEAVRLGLELRFGKAALAEMDAIRRIESLDVLERVKDALMSAASPADLRHLYAG